MSNSAWYDERERGTYVQKFRKEIDDIEYIRNDSTMVNSKNEIINFVREYVTPIPFGEEVGGWEEVLDNELENDFDR